MSETRIPRPTKEEIEAEISELARLSRESQVPEGFESKKVDPRHLQDELGLGTPSREETMAEIHALVDILRSRQLSEERLREVLADPQQTALAIRLGFLPPDALPPKK